MEIKNVMDANMEFDLSSVFVPCLCCIDKLYWRHYKAVFDSAQIGIQLIVGNSRGGDEDYSAPSNIIPLNKYSYFSFRIFDLNYGPFEYNINKFYGKHNLCDIMWRNLMAVPSKFDQENKLEVYKWHPKLGDKQNYALVPKALLIELVKNLMGYSLFYCENCQTQLQIKDNLCYACRMGL